MDLRDAPSHYSNEEAHAWLAGRESIDVDELLAEVRKHHVLIGVMASPSHWAYRGDWKPEGAAPRSEDETPGEWFAMCKPDRDGTVGCGWDSEPITYETREEAWAAGHAHVAEKIKEALG
jgi:hypothetical protein